MPFAALWKKELIGYGAPPDLIMLLQSLSLRYFVQRGLINGVALAAH